MPPCSDRPARRWLHWASASRQKAPLGTGRTDEYLYPVLLLLLASGAVRLWAAARSHLHPAHLRVVGTAVAVASLVLAGAVVGDAIATATPYPGVDVQALATALRHDAEPSDHIVVGELTRYPWAYYEDGPAPPALRSEAEQRTSPLSSTDPRVFIVPSEGYEGGSDPARWANELRLATTPGCGSWSARRSR